MADAPRDPRQLARDILSGKIKIEDLARERQARGGALPPVVKPPEQRAVAPRPPAPRPPPAPVMRPPVVPPRPLVRPQYNVSRPPVRAPQQQVKKRGPVIQQPAPPRIVSAAPIQPKAAPQDIQSAVGPATAAQAYGPTAGSPGAKRPGTANISSVRDMVKSRQSLRQGILMAEVLGKPVGLRE